MKEKEPMTFVITRCGQAIKFREDDSPSEVFIKLEKGDAIASHIIYDEEDVKTIVYITEGGFSARVKFSDIRVMGVGGAGVSFVKLTPETGTIKRAVGLVSKDTEIRIVTTRKTIILDVKEIPLMKRGGSCVRVIKLQDKEKITDIKINTIK